MVATSFPESNHVLDKPAEMTYDECDPLSVWVGRDPNGVPLVISQWKLTKEELAEVNRTGRVWLTVFGVTMQPVALHTASPFVPQENR